MKAKEKAKELFRKMHYQKWMDHHHAKHCTLVAVDEILELNIFWCEKGSMPAHHYGIETTEEYWQEVRTEIEKL